MNNDPIRKSRRRFLSFAGISILAVCSRFTGALALNDGRGDGGGNTGGGGGNANGSSVKCSPAKITKLRLAIKKAKRIRNRRRSERIVKRLRLRLRACLSASAGGKPDAPLDDGR